MLNVSRGAHPNTKVLIHPIRPFLQHKSGVICMPTTTKDVWDGLSGLRGDIPWGFTGRCLDGPLTEDEGIADRQTPKILFPFPHAE